MLKLITLILGIAAIQARVFNNPVLGTGDNNEPGGIKVNGTYYITTRNMNSTQIEKIAIHESTNLINWKPAGYVFDQTNYPTWATKTSAFYYANIHKIGDNFNVYFYAYHDVTGMGSIGVAIAPHPLGPYTAADRPLWTDSAQNHDFPTIANDNGNLYLISKFNTTIIGRQLNSNGFSFATDQTIELIRANLTWETTFVEAPWYIRKGDYHYIMYTAGSGCEGVGVGIARSRNVLGPYEKLADPILVSNSEFKYPHFNSGFRDLDGYSDLIVFQTYKANAGCTGEQAINLASVGWHANDWPYIYDY